MIRAESRNTVVAVVYVDQDWLVGVLSPGAGVAGDPVRTVHLNPEAVTKTGTLLDSFNSPNASNGAEVLTVLSDLLTFLALTCPQLVALTHRRREVSPTTIRALTVPRLRSAAPVRAEARHVAELLWREPSVRWTLSELGVRVHLSESQLFRVFVAAYGRTPLVYQGMIRVRLMAELLATTTLSIGEISEHVGWRSRSWGSARFRQVAGRTPTEYRRGQGQR
jgi:AraC-like DNA-binding protein